MAAACTSSWPAARRARAASARVEPVVTMSSTMTMRPVGVPVHDRAPCRLARRCSAVSSDWSRGWRVSCSALSSRTGQPSAARTWVAKLATRAQESSPRRRRAAADAGIGTTTSSRAGSMVIRRRSSPSSDAAIALASARARCVATSRRPRSFQAVIIARVGPAYSATTCRDTHGDGTGLGVWRRGRPISPDSQARQTAAPARSQPAQAGGAPNEIASAAT